MTKGRPIAASIFRCAGSLGWQLWEGCVLFYSSFPKINAVFAGDNHRAAVVARWPSPGLPHPAAFCQPKKPIFTAQNSHPANKNRRKADTKTNMTQCVLHPLKSAQIMAFFYQCWWQCKWFWWMGGGFLNVHMAGTLEPFYLRNNRTRGLHNLTQCFILYIHKNIIGSYLENTKAHSSVTV